MDYITNLISQISPTLDNFSNNKGGGNADNLAQNLKSSLEQVINSKNINSGNLEKISANKYLLNLPNNNNILKGVNQLTLSTQKALPSFSEVNSYKILINNINFSELSGKNSTIKIEGTLNPNFTSGQAGQSSANGQPIKFTSEINLSQLQGGNSSSANNQNVGKTTIADEVITNRVLNNNFSSAINISEAGSSLKKAIEGLISQAQLSSGNNNNITSSQQNTGNFQVTNNANKTYLVQFRVESFSLPGNQVSFSNSNNPNQQNLISGTYNLQSNQPVIKLDSGNIINLPQRLDIPSGSNITLSVTNVEALNQKASLDNLNLNNLNANSLKQVLTSENSPLNIALKSLLSIPQGPLYASQIVPEANNKQSYAKALWFVSALQNDNFEEWIGKENILRFGSNNNKSGEKILDNFREFFNMARQISSKAEIASNGEYWQNYILPLSFESEPNYLRFYINRDSQNSSDKNSKEDKKFIVELDQENFGKILIEGLYQNNKTGGLENLNLVMSTSKEMPKTLTNEIEELFHSIASAMDFNGNISFRDKIPDVDIIIEEEFSTEDILV